MALRSAKSHPKGPIMILYGSSLSPFVRKVMLFCAAGGIEYTAKPVGLGSDDAGFLTASPLRKMPAICDDDGFCLADSSAICHYLEAKHRPGLIPADAQGLGRAVWLDECADTVLFMALQPAFFNRIIGPLFAGRTPDEAAAARAMADAAPAALAWLESEVPTNGYLMGDRISFADCAVASPLVNLAHIRTVSGPDEAGGGDLAPYPKVAAYWERMQAWEPLAQTLTFEAKAIAKAQERAAARQKG
jgi:glutathione S-transferase